MTTGARGALPEPTAEAARHSARLCALLDAQIAAAGGSIPFERYMDLALYAPGLGYYSAGAAKLGADGDFITAAETSALYARCVAAQCREVLAALDGGAILELGAGSGAMAAEILACLAEHEALPASYQILDVSAELRARQRATLEGRVPALCERVAWLDRLPERPLRGVVLASEVVDALPVALFRIGAAPGRARIEELVVTRNDAGFALVATAARGALAEAVAAIERDLPAPLPAGYRSECRPALRAWTAAVAATLEAGVVLVVDYGLPRREYYAPERSDGTLLCHYRHRAHADPFHLPGLQDIGAWVDFTALARAGTSAGLELAGFTTQAHFLIGSGLEAAYRGALERAPARAAQLAREVQRLTLPGEMGERFRVLGLARNCAAPLCGFALRDLTRTL
jgi:SAM-dependent MidA family methyltransferase